MAKKISLPDELLETVPKNHQRTTNFLPIDLIDLAILETAENLTKSVCPLRLPTDDFSYQEGEPIVMCGLPGDAIRMAGGHYEQFLPCSTTEDL